MRRELIRDIVVYVTFNEHAPAMRHGLLRACHVLKARPDLLKIEKSPSGVLIGTWHNGIGGSLGDFCVLFTASGDILDVWLSQYMEDVE